MNGSLGISGGLTLSLSTENAATAKYIYQMLLEIYQIRAEIRVHQKTTLSKNRVYTVFIEDKVNELLNELQLSDSLMFLDSGIPESVKYDQQAQEDYMRGLFYQVVRCIIQKKAIISCLFLVCIRNMLKT